MVPRLYLRVLRGVSLVPLFFVYIMPDPLLAVRLELRQAETAATDLSLLVGQEFEVDLWVDSENVPLSGAAVFISFNEDLLELVGEDQDPVIRGFQPFAPGDFLTNGETFRNVLLPENDPAASPFGVQLDYSVVRAVDKGRGAAASFKLRAKAPTLGTVIRIDESGIRETRFFKPDGSHKQFHFIRPLSVKVRGIGIEGLPSKLVMARGAMDTTTFLLDEALFDPVYSADDIEWTVNSAGQILVDRLPEGNRLHLTAPTNSSPWEQLTITAANPDGQFAIAVVDIFVNESPSLSRTIPVIEMIEDGVATLDLESIVHDPDSPLEQLRWSVESEDALRIDMDGFVASLHPQSDWSGEAEITVIVSDNYDFADTTLVGVTVHPINDAPQVRYSPNVQLTLGKQDSSLTLGDVVFDPDNSPESLDISWTGNTRISVELRRDRIVLTAPSNWVGAETIDFTVYDSENLSAAGILTVNVVPSLPPTLINAPERLGIVAGDRIILELSDLVVDPDDPEGLLSWNTVGQRQLSVNVNTSGAALIEAPTSFSGLETITFIVTDPSGESARFELLVFGAPSGGEPIVAPAPKLAVPLGGIDASIDLDEHVFDLDHDPAVMAWQVSEIGGIDLRVDPNSHVLTVVPIDSSAVGTHQVRLNVNDPTGNEATLLVELTVTIDADSPTVNEPLPEPIPTLATLPNLTIHAGSFDQSLILDNFVSGVDPTSLTWNAESGDHTQVLIDSATRRVTVLADADWSGPEIVLLRAVTSLGNIVEAVLAVQIISALVELELAEFTEVDILEGDSQFFLDIPSLLLNGKNPADLTWKAVGAQPIAVAYNAATGELAFTTTEFGEETDLVTVTARDDAGNQATGSVLLHVHPPDGSFGKDSDDIRIVVIPNAIQPDYLDVYFINRSEANREPRLRLRTADEWSDLEVVATADRIWHGIHVLQPGMNGEIGFVGLTAAMNREIIKTETAISVGTVAPGSAKRVATARFSTSFEGGSFSRTSVVALIPGVATTPGQPELNPLSKAMRIHATSHYTRQDASVSFNLEGLNSPYASVYRWAAEDDSWEFVGGEVHLGLITAKITNLGRYAVFEDRTAPRIWLEDTTTETMVYGYSDFGSGIADVRVTSAGNVVPDEAYQMNSNRLTFVLSKLPTSHRDLQIEAVDHAGNRNMAKAAINRLARPLAMELGQNFPNPFNPETIIPLQTPFSKETLRLRIFNVSGQLVRTLHNHAISSGVHQFLWDGKDDSGRGVSSGVYLYIAEAGSMTLIRKMNLVR